MAYTKEQLAQLVIDYANSYGIDPAIALVQIKRESANFRSDVVYGPFRAGAGERGLAQFTPATWADWGQGPHTDAYIPERSMDAWGRYMTWLLRRYGGNYTKALQGYNGGPGNVDRGTVSQAAQRYAREVLEQAGRTQISGGSSSDLPDSSYPDIAFDDDILFPSGDSPTSPDGSNSSITPVLLISAAAIVAVVLLTD